MLTREFRGLLALTGKQWDRPAYTPSMSSWVSELAAAALSISYLADVVVCGLGVRFEQILR
jgi:hypothetical protein